MPRLHGRSKDYLFKQAIKNGAPRKHGLKIKTSNSQESEHSYLLGNKRLWYRVNKLKIKPYTSTAKRDIDDL